MEETGDLTEKLFSCLSFIALSYILFFTIAKAAKQAVTDLKGWGRQALKCECSRNECSDV